MKTTSILSIVILAVFCSCSSGEKTKAQKADFGIYETIKMSEITSSLIDSIKVTGMQPELDKQLPVIGYILRDDSIDLQAQNIKFSKTYFPVDKEGKYYALVATRSTPVINNSDIQNTKVKNQNVEIYFNMAGAKKWAEMTKNNIGKSVAFIIDNKIYTMPLVNAEIRNGMALINGLKDEATAQRISNSLNAKGSE